MTPLEAMAALASARITEEGTQWCHFCRGLIEDPNYYEPPLPLVEQHKPDCPVPVLPKIVAVLEAAEAWRVALSAEKHDVAAFVHVEQQLIDALTDEGEA